MCIAPHFCQSLPLQVTLIGKRNYDPSFSVSHNERMLGLNCSVCSHPPSCVESSAQADQCIMCTVPGLAPTTNYTVSVAALSDAGTGASSKESTKLTQSQSKLYYIQ